MRLPLLVSSTGRRAAIVGAVGVAVVVAAVIALSGRDAHLDSPEQPLASHAGERPSGARFIEKLRSGERVVIVTMGTSLTHGKKSWVPAMRGWLRESFPGRVTFYDEARPSGASTNMNPDKSGIAALPRVIAHDPDVVFIEFAFNDAYRPYKISLEESRKNLNTMIDTILAHGPDTEIIVQTMNCAYDIPGDEFKPATERRKLAAYYQASREVAAERGLMLIDHYPNWLELLRKDPERFVALVPDGIHPTADGAREVMLPELESALLGEESSSRAPTP